MFDAITAQPAAIADVVARNREGIATLARALKDTPSLTLAGLGPSLNGAIFGEYWMRTVGRMASVRAVSSFETVLYGTGKPAASSALLVLSHRGWKEYSARAIAEAKAAGIVTAAICGQGAREGATQGG